MACIFVSPYGGERTATLGALWDKIALSDREKDVVEALRIIDPEISAVSMVGGEGPRRMRTAIVRSDNISRPVPLRSFGDGLNRLFGIVLSLVNAKDGTPSHRRVRERDAPHGSVGCLADRVRSRPEAGYPGLCHVP